MPRSSPSVTFHASLRVVQPSGSFPFVAGPKSSVTVSPPTNANAATASHAAAFIAPSPSGLEPGDTLPARGRPDRHIRARARRPSAFFVFGGDVGLGGDGPGFGDLVELALAEDQERDARDPADLLAALAVSDDDVARAEQQELEDVGELDGDALGAARDRVLALAAAELVQLVVGDAPAMVDLDVDPGADDADADQQAQRVQEAGIGVGVEVRQELAHVAQHR